MSKLSQQVENQLAVSGKVAASARTHGKKIAYALAQRAAAAAAAEGADCKATAKVHELVIVAFADQLDASADALLKAELAYTAEQADDVPLRSARDAAHTTLLDAITGARAAAEGALGRDALKKYGLHGDTPRKPVRATLNHVGNVIHLLEKAPAVVNTDFGTSFNTASVAAALKTKHAALAARVDEMDNEARELESALTVRDRAAAAWSETYQGVADALTGMYRLAGWIELAERVRPTARTVRGEDAGPDVSEGVDPSAPAEPAAP